MYYDFCLDARAPLRHSINKTKTIRNAPGAASVAFSPNADLSFNIVVSQLATPALQECWSLLSVPRPALSCGKFWRFTINLPVLVPWVIDRLCFLSLHRSLGSFSILSSVPDCDAIPTMPLKCGAWIGGLPDGTLFYTAEKYEPGERACMPLLLLSYTHSQACTSKHTHMPTVTLPTAHWLTHWLGGRKSILWEGDL